MWCAYHAVRFFVKVHRLIAANLAIGKRKLCAMTENMQARCLPSRQCRLALAAFGGIEEIIEVIFQIANHEGDHILVKMYCIVQGNMSSQLYMIFGNNDIDSLKCCLSAATTHYKKALKTVQ